MNYDIFKNICRPGSSKSYFSLLGMLNKVPMFELRFNYSYLNSNAGNLIFVCKSPKGIDKL